MSGKYSVDLFFLRFVIISLVILQHTVVGANDDNVNELSFLFRVSERLKSPLRIATDEQDNVYVTDAVGGRICKYDSAGNFISEIKVGTSPLAVASTHQRKLLVSDRLSGEVQLVDSEGQLIKKVTTGTGGFALPSSAVTDDLGRLYVVDSKKGRVYLFDVNGNFLSFFGDGILIFPTGIAYDQKNKRLLVADHGGLYIDENSESYKMIHAFDTDGQWQTSFGNSSGDGQFARIQGMTVDRFGRIYVADIYQAVITVFSEKGEILTTVGRYGERPGELRAPMDIAIDSRGRLWVTSMNNGCIEIFETGDIPTKVNSIPETILPSHSGLLQNYPNPFNPGTWIPFQLQQDSQVLIRIYNETGQLVRTFELGKKKSGSYLAEGNAVFWDGTNGKGEKVASGVYIYEIRLDDFVAVKRMLLLK